MSFRTLAVLGVTLLGATPLAAQPPAPPPADAPAPGKRFAGRHMMMFEGMSEAGRKLMTDAMRDARGGDHHAEVKAARDRALALVEAERLDVAALRRAQADERAVVARYAQRRQEALLAAIQKLSLADRRIFVANMRDMDERMRERMKKVRSMMDQQGRPLSPPPPPPGTD